MSRRLRWRIVAGVAVVLAGLVGGVVGSGWVWLRSQAGNEFLRLQVERWASEWMVSGEVRVAELHTDLWSSIQLRGLSILDEAGREVIAAPITTIEVNALALMTGTVHLRRFVVRRVGADLRRSPDGSLEIIDLFVDPVTDVSSEELWSGLPFDVVIDELDVGLGKVSVGDHRFAGLQWRSGVSIRGPVVEVSRLAAVTTLVAPGPLGVAITGNLQWSPVTTEINELRIVAPNVDLTADVVISTSDRPRSIVGDVQVSQVDFRVVEPFIDLGLGGVFQGTMAFSGPADQVAAEISLSGVDDTRGDLELTAVLDVMHPSGLAWNATLDAEQWLVNQVFVDGPPELGVTGILEAAGEGVSWPDGVRVAGVYRGEDLEVLGYRVTGPEIDFVLEHGRLTMPRMTLDGIVGRVTGEGSVDIDDGPMRFEFEGPVSSAHLADLGVDDVAGDLMLELLITGNRHQEGMPLAIDGTLRGTPARYGDEITVREVRAGFSGEVRGSDVDLRVTAQGRGVSAWGVAMDRIPALGATVQVRESGVRATGAATLHGVVAQDGVSTEVLEVRFDVVAPTDGPMVSTAELEVESWLVFGCPGTDGHATVSRTGDDLALSVELFDTARTALSTSLEMDLASREIELATLVLGLTPRATWMSEGPVQVRLTEHGIADAAVVLTSPLGRIAVEGLLSTSGLIDGQVKVDDFQLDVIAELMPDRYGDLAGELDGFVIMTGSTDDPTVTAEIDLEGLWVPDTVRWLDVVGRVEWTAGVLHPDLQLGVAGVPFAQLGGRVPVQGSLLAPALATDGREMDVQMWLRPGPLERVRWVLPDPSEIPSGSIAADLRVTGAAVDPDVLFNAVIEVPVGGWMEHGRVEIEAERRGEHVSWWVDGAEGFRRLVSVDGAGSTRLSEATWWAFSGGEKPDLGDYALWVDDLETDIRLLDIPTASLLSFIGSDLDIDGTIFGALRLVGSPWQPMLSGNVDLRKARFGEARGGGSFALKPEASGYSMDARVGFEDGGSVRLEGELPAHINFRIPRGEWATGTGTMELRGHQVPLGVVAALYPEISDAVGDLWIEGAVTGGLTTPRADVALGVEGGSLRYRPLGLQVHDIAMEAAVNNEAIALTRFSARTEPVVRGLRTLLGEATAQRSPNITATGAVGLDAWTPRAVDGMLNLKDAWLMSTDTGRWRLGGDVAVTGMWPDLDVHGEVEVAQGLLSVDTNAWGGSSRTVVDPHLRIHRLVRSEPTPPIPGAPSLFDTVDVALDVDLGRNIEINVVMPFLDDFGAVGAAVTQLILESRVGGEVDVRIQHGVPQMSGVVDLITGRVRVLQAEFDLETGRIVFAGDDLTNPMMEMEAFMGVSGGEVEARVSGRFDKPEISFSSDEFPDQTQIFTILLTGVAPEELSADDGKAAATAVAGMLLTSVLGGVELGSFAVEPDGTIRVGIPVHKSVYIESMVNPDPDLNENQATVEVDWSLTRRLVLSAAYGDRESWAHLVWEGRF